MLFTDLQLEHHLAQDIFTEVLAGLQKSTNDLLSQLTSKAMLSLALSKSLTVL